MPIAKRGVPKLIGSWLKLKLIGKRGREKVGGSGNTCSDSLAMAAVSKLLQNNNGRVGEQTAHEQYMCW